MCGPTTGHPSENYRAGCSLLRSPHRTDPCPGINQTPHRGRGGRSRPSGPEVFEKVVRNSLTSDRKLSKPVERAHISLFPLKNSSERTPGAQSKILQTLRLPLSSPADSLSLSLTHSSQQNIRAEKKTLVRGTMTRNEATLTNP